MASWLTHLLVLVPELLVGDEESPLLAEAHPQEALAQGAADGLALPDLGGQGVLHLHLLPVLVQTVVLPDMLV